MTQVDSGSGSGFRDFGASARPGVRAFPAENRCRQTLDFDRLRPYYEGLVAEHWPERLDWSGAAGRCA